MGGMSGYFQDAVMFQLSVLRGDKAKATLGMWMGGRAASLITDPLQKVERTFVLVM